jgi:exodeoxyribonuclease-3
MIKIASWNVNSLKVRLEQVLDWLQKTNCDILAIQELKLDNDNFPIENFNKIGYNCVYNGQKTYNGVAIISKFPIDNVIYDMPDYNDIQKRVISATIKNIRIICAYVVNGESTQSDKFIYKMAWMENFKNYIQYNLIWNKKLIVLGDFNIAPNDIDVYDVIKWQNSILFTDREKELFNNILALGLYDSFRLVNNNDKQYTWWDYRNFSFKRNLGLRIDHILVSQDLKQYINDCVIDIEPRKNERPSDHTPIILELDI